MESPSDRMLRTTMLPGIVAISQLYPSKISIPLLLAKYISPFFPCVQLQFCIPASFSCLVTMKFVTTGLNLDAKAIAVVAVRINKIIPLRIWSIVDCCYKFVVLWVAQ